MNINQNVSYKEVELPLSSMYINILKCFSIIGCEVFNQSVGDGLKIWFQVKTRLKYF